jgi:hypothetical protein
MMVCAYVTVPYGTACTCERGVVVPRGVRVRREEINTRYGVMPVILYIGAMTKVTSMHSIRPQTWAKA